MSAIIKYLGTANGWYMGVPMPIEYLAHEQAIKAGEKHDLQVVNIGRCLNRHTCTTCGISYDVDSSD